MYVREAAVGVGRGRALPAATLRFPVRVCLRVLTRRACARQVRRPRRTLRFPVRVCLRVLTRRACARQCEV